MFRYQKETILEDEDSPRIGQTENLFLIYTRFSSWDQLYSRSVFTFSLHLHYLLSLFCWGFDFKWNKREGDKEEADLKGIDGQILVVLCQATNHGHWFHEWPTAKPKKMVRAWHLPDQLGSFHQLAKTAFPSLGEWYPCLVYIYTYISIYLYMDTHRSICRI